MNLIIHLAALLSFVISIGLFRLRSKSKGYRWIALAFYCIAIALFINLYGTIGGFFIGIPASLACGLLIAFFLGKQKD
ncbi:hypothetical protein [Pseudocolwellia agarivorans]|jgi:hypothetical protein|uniref:hypothetical protein n=1 Tax=Pseudocolwellia agarivorans TaxID=1911682 RepID=UPI003F8828AE